MSSSDMDDTSSMERTPSPPTENGVNGAGETFSEEEHVNGNNNVNKINDSHKQNSSSRKPPPSTKLFILPMSSTRNKQKSPPEIPFKPPQYQKQDFSTAKTLQEVLASTSTKTIEKSFHISEDEVINERQAVLESLKPKTKRLNSWVLTQKLEQESGDGGVVTEHVYDPHQLDELQQYTVKLETEQDDPHFPKESHKAYEERRNRQKREEQKRKEGIVVALKPRATGEIESQSYLKQKLALKAMWEERMIAEQQEQERDLPPLININQSNPPLHEAQRNRVPDDESDTRGNVISASPEPHEEMNVVSEENSIVEHTIEPSHAIQVFDKDGDKKKIYCAFDYMETQVNLEDEEKFHRIILEDNKKHALNNTNDQGNCNTVALDQFGETKIQENETTIMALSSVSTDITVELNDEKKDHNVVVLTDSSSLLSGTEEIEEAELHSDRDETDSMHSSDYASGVHIRRYTPEEVDSTIKDEEPINALSTAAMIAREIREFQEREEELRRERSADSPCIPFQHSTPNEKEDISRAIFNSSPHLSTTDSNRSFSPFPPLSGHVVNETSDYASVEDSDTKTDSTRTESPEARAFVIKSTDEKSSVLCISDKDEEFFHRYTESAVEREIRVAKEREEELRKEKGMPPLPHDGVFLHNPMTQTRHHNNLNINVWKERKIVTASRMQGSQDFLDSPKCTQIQNSSDTDDSSTSLSSKRTSTATEIDPEVMNIKRTSSTPTNFDKEIKSRRRVNMENFITRYGRSSQSPKKPVLEETSMSPTSFQSIFDRTASLGPRKSDNEFTNSTSAIETRQASCNTKTLGLLKKTGEPKSLPQQVDVNHNMATSEDYSVEFIPIDHIDDGKSQQSKGWTPSSSEELRQRQYSGDVMRHTYKTGWDIMQEELREMKQREQELRSQRLRAVGASNAMGYYQENQDTGNTQEVRPNSTLELRRRFEQMMFQAEQQ